MDDYSQYGEQAAILAALKEKSLDDKPARFLDIGAWNAKTFSNTRALYELGWGGVLIEPSPGPVCGLLDVYGNNDSISIVQAAVVADENAPRLMRMWVSDDAISTANAAEHETWKQAATWRGERLVPTLPIMSIFNQFGGFAVVNIDAEGSSAEMFLTMLRGGIYPTVVVVEHDGRLAEIASAATALNYRITLANSTNAVLVR